MGCFLWGQVSLRSGDSGMASMPEDEEEQLEQTRQHEAYQLTGRAGSYFYMAPEVVMCVPYNEKASTPLYVCWIGTDQ